MKKSQIMKVLSVFLFSFAIAGCPSAGNISDGSVIKQSGTVPVPINPEKITYLVAERARRSPSIGQFPAQSSYGCKRFWLKDWTKTDEFIEWQVEVSTAGLYELTILAEAPQGTKVKVQGKKGSFVFTLPFDGWQREVAGSLKLPKGKSVIRLTLAENSKVAMKSLELINVDSKAGIVRRIKDFRSDTSWLAEAGYGVMFQAGEWCYPPKGNKKPWPGFARDFDLEKFADMVEETGARFVVWSATWATYFFPAPIKAIDKILPGRTCKRDLIMEIADALDKRGIKLILYYHVGHGNNPNMDWWDRNWNPKWEQEGYDKSLFFKNWISIITEVGERYGKKLAAWMFDDDCVIYPADYEALGRAAKAGYDGRLISYNCWIACRFTEFQDFYFGEGFSGDSRGRIEDGKFTEGPLKGLQAFGCIMLDGPNWGVRKPNTIINPPNFSIGKAVAIARRAIQTKQPIAFNLMMYEDGSVSQDSMNVLQEVRQAVREGKVLKDYNNAEQIQDISYAKSTIYDIVRAAGSSSVLNKGPISKGKVLPEFAEHEEAVKQWMSLYGESIAGTRGGPFEPTENYVTTFKEDRIYVHVLDWTGKNHLILPPVTDRLVKKAYLLNGEAASKEGALRVSQSPWGLLIVVTRDRQDDLDTIVVLEMEGKAAELMQPRITEVDSSTIILLRGDTAKLNGKLTYNPGPNWIEGWTNPSDVVFWRIKLPEAGDYEIALTYACAKGAGGSELEVATENSKVTGIVRETSGWVGGWQNFERIPLHRTLRLPAGISTIAVRITQKAETDEIIRLHALELISPTVKNAMAAAKERAERLRASTDWFVAAQYGVMFHWTPGTQPRRGAQKRFPEAVRDFDVNTFADMVKETGAGYVIFTAVHGIQWFPGPIQTIEKILPGRTCQRDLIGDMADALQKRGIKLILYYHHGVGDYEWSKASGFYQKDKSQFFENERDILTEIGLRYGKKVAGYWFDDRYPLQPFEKLYRATKAGNSDRIVAWNSWILPKTTDFQEYYAGEFGGALRALPEASYFQEEGPAAGLQPHVLIFLDDPWHHGYPNTDIAPPLFTNQQLIDYVKNCNARNVPVTMNLGIYQDGTVSPATLEQMKALRRAVKGNGVLN